MWINFFGEEQWGISLSEGGQDFIQVADRQTDSAPGLPYLPGNGIEKRVAGSCVNVTLQAVCLGFPLPDEKPVGEPGELHVGDNVPFEQRTDKRCVFCLYREVRMLDDIIERSQRFVRKRKGPGQILFEYREGFPLVGGIRAGHLFIKREQFRHVGSRPCKAVELPAYPLVVLHNPAEHRVVMTAGYFL